MPETPANSRVTARSSVTIALLVVAFLLSGTAMLATGPALDAIIDNDDTSVRAGREENGFVLEEASQDSEKRNSGDSRFVLTSGDGIEQEDEDLGGDERQSLAPAITAQVDRLIQSHSFVDLHADTILRMARRKQDLLYEYRGAEVDIPKLRRAGIGLQFFSICSPPSRLRKNFETWQDFSFINYFKNVMDEHPQLEQAFGAADARRIMSEGRIAVVLSLEGAGVILEDPGRLQTLYDAGMRAIGPVWNITNLLADSARDEPRWGGLSPAGVQAIREMNRLGIMIDVSHASRQAFWDILQVSTRPVFASHSNAYARRAHARNLEDDQIRAIAEQGGVIGVAFHRTFLKRGRGPATLDDVIAHIRHITAIGGMNSVAIGTDFGGGAILPAGLGHAGQLRNLIEALLAAGFTEEDVVKIMGGNAWRYFETVSP